MDRPGKTPSEAKPVQSDSDPAALAVYDSVAAGPTLQPPPLTARMTMVVSMITLAYIRMASCNCAG